MHEWCVHYMLFHNLDIIPRPCYERWRQQPFCFPKQDMDANLCVVATAQNSQQHPSRTWQGEWASLISSKWRSHRPQVGGQLLLAPQSWVSSYSCWLLLLLDCMFGGAVMWGECTVPLVQNLIIWNLALSQNSDVFQSLAKKCTTFSKTEWRSHRINCYGSLFCSSCYVWNRCMVFFSA